MCVHMNSREDVSGRKRETGGNYETADRGKQVNVSY